MDLVDAASPFQNGDKVVVLDGRHFQDFAAGDSGIVIRADAESRTCQVHFTHRPGESFNVAWRHLSKGSARVSTPSGLVQEEAQPLERPSENGLLPMVENLGDALGTVSLAGFWEAKLADLDAGFRSPWKWTEPSTQNDAALETPTALKDSGDDLAMAVEGCAKATSSNILLALRESKLTSSRVQDLEEKLSKHSREHWLGLDCLQEKVNSIAVSQKEVNADFKASLQKELASVKMQVQSLHDQHEAIKDMVQNLKTEVKFKASQVQLEDLEHQQCKAMESLLRRWDRCAEVRRAAVESTVTALDEVQRPESPKAPEAAMLLRLEEVVTAHHDLNRKVDRLQANYQDMHRSSVPVSRLESLSQEQQRLKDQLQRLAQVKPILEDRSSLESWQQPFKGLSAKVETLQQQLGALRRDFDKAQEKAEKEKAMLDGLRLRADAAAEGLASEVRLREEGVLRVETQLQSMTREMEVAMETLRGSLEKQLHGMLTSAHSTAEQKQREWQQECQKRQEAEEALREHQVEVVELRSKLFRKEQALLEATGLAAGVPAAPGGSASNFSEPVAAPQRGPDALSPLSRRLAAPVACHPVSNPFNNFA